MGVAGKDPYFCRYKDILQLLAFSLNDIFRISFACPLYCLNVPSSFEEDCASESFSYCLHISVSQSRFHPRIVLH